MSYKEMQVQKTRIEAMSKDILTGQFTVQELLDLWNVLGQSNDMPLSDSTRLKALESKIISLKQSMNDIVEVPRRGEEMIRT